MRRIMDKRIAIDVRIKKKQMKLVDMVIFFFALLPKLVQEEHEELRSWNFMHFWELL